MRTAVAIVAVAAGCGYLLLLLSMADRLASIAGAALGAVLIGDCPAQRLIPGQLIVSGCVTGCPAMIFGGSKVKRMIASFLTVCIGFYSVLSVSPEFEELSTGTDEDDDRYCNWTLYLVAMATAWLRLLRLLCELGFQACLLGAAAGLMTLGGHCDERGAALRGRALRPLERRLFGSDVRVRRRHRRRPGHTERNQVTQAADLMTSPVPRENSGFYDVTYPQDEQRIR